MIKQLFSLALLVLAVAVQSATACTITVGQYFPANPNPPNFTGYNVWSGFPIIGSMTGGTLPGGATIITATSFFNGGSDVNFLLQISGFSSDPGKSYFNTFTPGDGATYASASAYQYGFGNGIATWHWMGVWPNVRMLAPVGYTFTCAVNF